MSLLWKSIIQLTSTFATTTYTYNNNNNYII